MNNSCNTVADNTEKFLDVVQILDKTFDFELLELRETLEHNVLSLTSSVVFLSQETVT